MGPITPQEEFSPAQSWHSEEWQRWQTKVREAKTSAEWSRCLLSWCVSSGVSEIHTLGIEDWDLGFLP